MRPLTRYLLPLFLFFAMAAQGLQAQPVPANVKGFPQPYGPVNAGREFWLAFPANWDVPTAQSYYIRLYITSGVRTQVKVWVGQGIKKVINTVPNDIITVDLSPIEAQMFTRTDAAPVPNDQVYKKRAIHIEAGAPIVVYGMNRTSFTSDGLLALSVNSLGREYIIESYGAVVGRDGGIPQELPSQYMIVAPYDGTTVTINHPHRTPNHIAGETFTIQLDKGDVWSAMNVGFNSDMSGATIRSNKPISVMAGQNCTYIPNLLSFPACDHIVDMMLPTESWGKLYQAVPYQTRLRGDFYRVFAKEPGTTIYIDGAEYAYLPQVGGQEGDGWVEYRAFGKGLHEFSANKPIHVAQYNPSQSWDGVPSDPFFHVLTPVEQYQSGVLFCTPSADFPQNFLNVVTDSIGYHTLEIAPAGTENWVLLSSTAGTGVPRPFPTLINGKRYLGVMCEIRPGTYRMRSKGTFGAYLYGFSNFDSYGYPLSVATGDLSKADKDAPHVTKSQTCDGTIQATTSDFPDDDLVRTNLSSIELDPDPANTDNYELVVTPFEAGVTRQTKYTLSVINKSLPAKAVMVISDMAGNVTLDSVSYTPLAITMLPSPVDYGKLRVGSTLTKTVTISNLSQEPVTLTEILLKSGLQGFKILAPTGKVVLGPKGSATEKVDVQIEYTATIIRPDALQTYDDSVGVRDACGLRYLALVKAQVVKPMIRVSDHDFSVQPVMVETAPGWRMEVRNTSTIEGSTLTVSAYTGPFHNTTVKIFDLKSGDALTVPFTLEPNETREVIVTFTAPDVNVFMDTVFFASDAMDVTEGDDYGWLRGQGIKGELYATPYDWKRRRMNYDYPQTAGVTVNNRGDASVRVVSATIVGTDAASFSYSAAQIQGMTIPANGGSIPVDVTFMPRRTGPHTAKIVYTVDPAQDEEVSSLLEGYGTMPALETKDYSFGSMLVDQDETKFIDYNTEVDPTDRIAFTVPNREEIDSVTIIRFEWQTDNFNGKDDFTHTLTPATPLVMKAGDTYIVEGQFKARAGGTRIATLRAITNDNVDITSSWTGIGLVDNTLIALQATTLPALCAGTTGTITVTITNTGESDLTINGMEMDGGPFTIVDPVDPTASFVIPRGESREVTLVYTAQEGTQTANLRVTSDASNTQGGVSLQAVSGMGLDENWNTKLALKGTKDGGATAELGNQVTAELSLDNSFQGIPAGMSMSSYTVVLQYNPALLTPRLPAMVGPGSTNGSQVAVNQALTNLKAGKLVLTVTGSMGSHTAPLIQVPFAVLFSGNLVRDMQATVTSDAAPSCAVINPSQATINVAPICGLNLRMIELTAGSYTLDQNKPNPFNPVTKIRYAVGLDGPTTVQLFDAQGRLVQVLVNEHQQPGVYELTLDVTNLPSGNYYYTMVSGDYKETKMLTVTK